MFVIDIMPFCPACGFENASNQKFCNNCGTPLTRSTAPAHTPPPSPGQIPPTPTNSALQSRNIKMVIGIVVAIAIVAVVFFIGLPMMKSGQKTAGFEPATITSAPTFSPTPIPTPVETAVIFTQVTTAPSLSPTTQQTQSAMKTYTSSKFGFSIDYPAGWEVNEKNMLETPSLTRYDVIEFYSPSINRCDTDQTSCSIVRSTIMVEVETKPGTKELADYFVPEVARITSQNGAQITKRDSSFKLSGVKAYRLDYTATYNKNEVNLLSAYTLINNNAYIITYRAYAPVRLETSQFELYYNTAMDMFNSFNVKGAVTVLQ